MIPATVLYRRLFCVLFLISSVSILAGCPEPPALKETVEKESVETDGEADPVPQPTTEPEENAPTVPEPKPEPETKPESEPVAEKPKRNELAVAAEFEIKDPPQVLTQEQIEEGWIALFDGKTLFGWESNNDLEWVVRDGLIQPDSDAKGISVLSTTSLFTDYELICEFKAAEGGNSGVFLRTSADPPNPTDECYELNICDSHDSFKTGGLVGRIEPLELVSNEGEWQTFHVIAKGNHLEAELDGTKVLDYTDDSENPLMTGRIGLQKNKSLIQFRKIILKPLDMTPLFSGESLDGWQVVPGSDSSFEIEEGTIAVKGGDDSGRGFLETEQTWGDFLLQLDVKTNGEALNSGIFFRAEKGTAEAPSNGYEMQIQNGFKEEDRTQPADHGTGAIFRRNFARWINANDHEWFKMTLNASGPHLAVWVNGLQVTDWMDTRPEDPNPRKGLRTEAGHISIQGHDPTTDLNFKAIEIQSLQPGTN
ncbi:hypothetical protein Pla110_31130 [Polystyrenella longa]|uniref:3-keto-alpha-glucoside-1,2-lyase/3-keto-2-hydroxy-glucal hydratase domain-containing protein n=1 Tax=Polystyrenella longa TaxID=2528007 RepID=A0A518CQ67_9PLAN|nr:family 16 glycoside hydrolase [Polystyrenella longa]QDU81372.1 hypothetical protein Pla110_31130 [Polystyrenella longa]